MKNQSNRVRIPLLASLLLSIISLKAIAGSIQDVQHVVILMQENRSFDHYFGTLQGVRGYNDPNILLFQNGSSDLFQPYRTNFVLPFPITNTCVADVDHGEESGNEAWNNGWWNLWIPAKGPETAAYYTRTNLSYYYSLADAYTICDDNFSSFPGPTFPNRVYLFTGMIDPNGTGGGPLLDNAIPTNGFSWTTYPERLQAAGVSWKVYRPLNDWFGDALQWFAQYKNAAPGNPLYDRGMATVNNVVSAFAADVTNGTLPQVSWIIPIDLTVSDHPPYSVQRGEWFVNQILTALAANPSVLNSTVFILSYDENGGFYDHVPSPVPPPGTTNEFVAGEPLGLGVRVPMIIISPWTRGGRVCSQVFDHTSIIRFLETWTGVQEPNISAWRRQTCGDLTSAFNFTNPDFSLPSFPSAPLANCTGVSVSPPAVQSIPVQEAGTRSACPLPYQPDAWCYADCNSNRLFITMTNAGTASVHFAIYPNAYRSDGPWQYDTPPGSSVMDSFVVPLRNNLYDFTCYGPNGFQRRFAGNIQRDCNQIEITSLIDPAGGDIWLGLSNSSTNAVNFTVTDNLNVGTRWNFNVSAASTTNFDFSILATNNGWYNLTVTANADTNFLRHLVGHVETGSFSFTEIPAIVGNTLVTHTNIPPPPNTPAPNPIYMVINNLIAQYSLATADTNSLALTIGAYGTTCALIYPGWASNYVVQTSISLNPPVWIPLNAAIATISNCNVVILPETNTAAYFRLSQ
jgi:phospholipase C